jgi:hypothetical protein
MPGGARAWAIACLARAMAVAMIYPEPEKGGRGKKGSLSEHFSKALLSEARAVVPYPDLSKAGRRQRMGELGGGGFRMTAVSRSPR